MTEDVSQSIAASHDQVEDAVSRVTRLAGKLGFSANTITMALLTELELPVTARTVLFPMVADRVHHVLRYLARKDYQARRAEDREASPQARRERAGGSATARPQSVPTPERGSLAFLDFKVLMAGAPDGYKLYRHLTVPEHGTRQLMLEKNGKAVFHSARSHAWAAGTCQRHDVACLDDIDPEVLISELPEEGIRP